MQNEQCPTLLNDVCGLRHLPKTILLASAQLPTTKQKAAYENKTEHFHRGHPPTRPPLDTNAAAMLTRMQVRESSVLVPAIRTRALHIQLPTLAKLHKTDSFVPAGRQTAGAAFHQRHSVTRQALPIICRRLQHAHFGAGAAPCGRSERR